MKKVILAFILIIGAVFSAFGQNSGPIDLVLLLDTSSAMGSSYEKVNNYITGAFLSEFLRTGDTFHLITFSGTPRLDIARRISARGDIETIIGRMLIQYPIENGNDARAALNFAESYISSLPQRPKKIVMVSAGGADTDSIVSAAKQRLGSRNTTLDFVSVTDRPLANLPSSGRSGGQASGSGQRPTSTAQPPRGTSQAGGTQTPQGGNQPDARTTTPPPAPKEPTVAVGDKKTDTTQTGGTQTQQGTQSGGTQTTTQGGTQAGGTQATTQPPVSDKDTTGTSTRDDSVSSKPSEQYDYTDRTDNRTQRDFSSFNPPLLLIIGITAALLLLLLIIFVSRRLGSSPNRVMASVSSLAPPEKEDRFKDHSRDLASYAAAQSKKRVTPYTDKPIKEQVVIQPTINPAGPLLLNLYVEDQNTAIGKRNIHSLKSGYSLSVGGGKSDDFLVFLVPVPSNLGEIRRNGSQLTFIPRKPKYFPDIGSNEVRDCINKKIRVVSDKNYEMTFSFVMYEDPLIALNRVLQSIKVPG